MNYKNDLFLRACKREKTERTPIWIMRQAGRYLPEYRKIREKADFKTMVKTPELASEVTVQPVDIIGVDAAIIFSDILVIPEAMGLNYEMVESVGPRFHNVIKNHSDIVKLDVEHVTENLQYVFDAVKMAKQKINGRVPLIGFSGSPFTLMTYMLEGGGSKNYVKTKQFLFNYKDEAHLLLGKITDAVIKYLSAKIEAGVDAFQIFDSWGGVLSKSHYLEFSLKYIDRIVKEVKRINDEPSIVFSKGVHHSIKEISETGTDVISLDWTTSLSCARELTEGKTALQGNLDPVTLYADDSVIEKEAESVLADFGKGNGHIFNLGHGILPSVEPAKAKLLVDYIKEQSRKYHE
jgi:uroporphyrinogen decarboxylase